MLVDDSEDDLFLLRAALARVGLGPSVIALRDGMDAVNYLEGRGDYSDRTAHPLPCLIITDLKMPRMDGFELLQWLKAHDEFREIPTVVLSASGLERDRRRAAAAGCCAYFVKPGGFRELAAVVEHLDRTWITEHCQRDG